MREIERDIIEKLTELSDNDSRRDIQVGQRFEIERKKRKELELLLKELKKEPIGKTTQEFLSNEKLKQYLEAWQCKDDVKFRILIENYLTTTDSTLKKDFFFCN